MQTRLSCAVAAQSIIEEVSRSIPENLSDADRTRMFEAVLQIPSADAFMLRSTTRQEIERIATKFDAGDEWNPSPDVVLSTTHAFARQSHIEEVWPVVWNELVEALGVPDDDLLVSAAVADYLPDALLAATFTESQSFQDKIKNANRDLLALRKTLMRHPRGR